MEDHAFSVRAYEMGFGILPDLDKENTTAEKEPDTKSEGLVTLESLTRWVGLLTRAEAHINNGLHPKGILSYIQRVSKQMGEILQPHTENNPIKVSVARDEDTTTLILVGMPNDPDEPEKVWLRGERAKTFGNLLIEFGFDPTASQMRSIPSSVSGAEIYQYFLDNIAERIKSCPIDTIITFGPRAIWPLLPPSDRKRFEEDKNWFREVHSRPFLRKVGGDREVRIMPLPSLTACLTEQEDGTYVPASEMAGVFRQVEGWLNPLEPEQPEQDSGREKKER